MQFQKIEIRKEALKPYDVFEARANTAVRGLNRLRGALRRGGHKGRYDDLAYEFRGGAKDELRKKHYDKSLRLLWKAEEHLPFTSFRDCTREEKAMMQMADTALKQDERKELERFRSADYKALLDREYTQAEKQAIVNILSTIGHGEAYAWMVASQILPDVQSTGARAAVTMQVLEEAKHFVVLRELIAAFDCEIPRMSAWEYATLERILTMDGLEKFFGMNVVVEGLALSLFGMMSSLPGLEVLRLFHLDESRHTALPGNYFREFPMTKWEQYNPAAQLRRFSLIAPALPIFIQLERDLAELGIDSFEFGGSMVRKILHLADRVGFRLPLSTAQIQKLVNRGFNEHCMKSRPNFTPRDFFAAETTKGKRELDVEREVFQISA